MAHAKDTTGQLVVARAGHYLLDIIIARDLGWYEGTREELNVRALKILGTYPAKEAGDAVKQAMAQDGYGRGYGETGKLYPITEEQAEQIKAELAKVEPAETTPSVANKMDDMICPHCGTICYGDCQASK